MRAARPLAAGLALCATLGALAAPAMAMRLTIEGLATVRSTSPSAPAPATSTASAPGILNCRRQSGHIVLCRIFDERKTPVQARYRCKRLIRMTLDPRTSRLPVTGLGRWHC